jgi:hypothetical protein
MAVPKIGQAAAWKPDPYDNVKLKRGIHSCEKEDRSLDNLIAHIGGAVIRHVKNAN